MGAPKGGGFQQLPTFSPEQMSLFSQLLGGAGQSLGQAGNIADNPLYQQSAQAIQGFLPGGQGFAPIQQEAQRQFQQQTIPSILNAFGSGAKSSSALNQALAGAGQNLNTALGSQLAQMQLGAAGQGAQLAQAPFQQGLAAANLGLNTSPFAYQQKARPFWQDLITNGLQAAGTAFGAVR
jgi:hypothetical protein